MRIYNKRARYEYKLEQDKYEAGISLSGGEAKAIRTRHIDLSQSHARILNNEAYLINANIPIQGAQKYDSTRMRKLLFHKSEIVSILSKMKQRKLTLVPIAIYNKRSLRPGGRKSRIFKLELILGKPKRKFEKKESLKKKDIQREIQETLKAKAQGSKF